MNNAFNNFVGMLQDGEKGGFLQYYKVLQSLADPRSVVALLDSYLSGKEDDQNADSSYRHNNGFTKLSLFNSNQIHLRLHIWANEEDASIHNHAWDFGSIVLKGCLGFTNYAEVALSEKAVAYQKFKLREVRDQNGSIIEKEKTREGTVSLLSIGSYTIRPLCTHFVNYQIPHKSDVLEPGGATLVVTGRSKRNFSNVYFEKGEPRDNVYKLIDVAEKRDLVACVRNQVV
jgi:hypothetical protein